VSNQVKTYFSLSLSALFAVGVVVLVVNGLADMMHKPSTGEMTDEAIAERIAPVARLNTEAPIQPAVEAAPAEAPAEEAVATADEAPAAAGRSGQEVYNASCIACHDMGIAGAPKRGDEGAWGPFLEKGMDGMLQNAITGVNAMPPRGTCAACTDEELRAAIEYMTP
jgi:cytochrome c5